jgi:hypothetical protein
MSFKENYIQQLKDPRWQRRRLEIFERDGFTCKMCGDKTSTLHVHHKYYLPNVLPWEYDGKCLVTLCENCHEAEGASKYLQKDLMIVLFEAGFFNSDLQMFNGLLREFFTKISIKDFDYLITRIAVNQEFREAVERLINSERERLRNKKNSADEEFSL